MSPCFSSYCRVNFPRSVPYGAVKYQLWFVILNVGLVLVCVFPTVISNLLQLPWRLSSQAIVRLLVVFKINEKAIGVNVFILLFFSFFFYPRFPEGSCVMSYGFLSHNPFNTLNLERRKPLVITDFAWHSSLLAPTPVTIQDAEVFEVR